MRGPPGNHRVGAVKTPLAAAGVALVACVSLDVDGPELPACAVPDVVAPESEASAVVLVNLNEPPYEVCGAVVIAPTLLLTAVNCVTPLLSQDEEAGFIPPRCTPTGAALEDGRFLFRYSPTTAPSGSIQLAGEDEIPLGIDVSGVFVSSAASTCTPDVAIVQTRLALDLPAIPIRVEPAESPGDDVVIIGYDTSNRRLERNTTLANIVAVTSDSGSQGLPPRSLSLSRDTCTKPGGAVLAADTGALIGLIQTTDRTINCSTATGSPIAVRLAPYRQFIMEVARSTQTTLKLEFASDQAGVAPTCEDLN